MRQGTRHITCALLMLFVVGAPDGWAAESETAFLKHVLPVLERRCLRCHGEKKQRGGINFAEMKTRKKALRQYPVWKKVTEEVTAGRMPPQGRAPLSAEEKRQLLNWIEKTFVAKTPTDPGPPLTRQLTRDEYAQTIRDLLRIRVDVAREAGIPRENVVDGFANRAGGLVLEQSLMEKYFTAADLALDRLFKDGREASARRALLVAKPSKDLSAEQATRKVLQSFMRRAFRRPVTDAEVNRYLTIARASLAANESFELAIRKAMKPVLVSPHFLLRIESGPKKPGSVGPISDHELAVRLSYFLWATMPDDQLFALADKGTLSRPEVLEKQVRRMLADNRARALTEHFLTRWLQLPHLRKALPTQNQFPAFTRNLRRAMERETWLFCDHLRQKDRSLLELLDAEYTFVNAELARHYQLAQVPKRGFEKVRLRPQDHRGGVLGMGSILTMTSHTDRTKPTARGKWILEVLLGTPPPPPPANAGNFAPSKKDRPEPRSFREKLARHASDPNCAGCHKKVDPLGFALENYDAIGTWRDSIGGAKVDNVGVLPGVGEFRGVDGLRKVLKAKQPQFVRHLVAQTLSYALGRNVSYYDEPTISKIVTALKQDQYRFSTLILEVVKSYPFRYRKAEPEK